jgi:hypothetical protein
MTKILKTPVNDLVESTLVSKSYKIRELYHTHKFSKSAIAMVLGIRYQHVRNVLLQPLKKG